MVFGVGDYGESFRQKATAGPPWLHLPGLRSLLGCAALFDVFGSFTVRAISRASILARLLRGRILRVVNLFSALRRTLPVWISLVSGIARLLPRVLLLLFSFVSHKVLLYKKSIAQHYFV
jgi:hypothetical protein